MRKTPPGLDQSLPWVRVENDHAFEGTRGQVSLPELFAGRSQLIVYHFMFGPDDDEGCPHCSFWADNFDGDEVHLNQRDVTFVAVSRAPLAKLQAFEQRMGWSFTWVSSFGSDFNYTCRSPIPLEWVGVCAFPHPSSSDTARTLAPSAWAGGGVS